MTQRLLREIVKIHLDFCTKLHFQGGYLEGEMGRKAMKNKALQCSRTNWQELKQVLRDHASRINYHRHEIVMKYPATREAHVTACRMFFCLIGQNEKYPLDDFSKDSIS